MKKIARKTKRFLSLFMTLMMIVSVIPASSLNVYAEETMQSEEESSIAVEVEWASKDAFVKVGVYKKPANPELSVLLYKDDEIINEYKPLCYYEDDEEEFTEYQQYYPYSPYIKESGKYRLELIVDGETYNSSVWDYHKPERKVPDLKNVKIEADKDGNPIAISFDSEEDFENELYHYQLEANAVTRGILYDCYIHSYDCEISEGRATYELGFYDDYYAENEVFDFSIWAISNDVEKIVAEGILGNLLYVCGEPKGIPVGPQNVEFDINTGKVKYVVGDEAPSEDIYYLFVVKTGSKVLNSIKYYPKVEGEECELSFNKYITNAGEYALEVYTYWKVYDEFGEEKSSWITNTIIKDKLAADKPEVQVEWDKKTGLANVIFNEAPSESKYIVRLLKDGEVYMTYERTYYDDSYASIQTAYDIDLSGTYKVEVVLGDKTYCSEEWNYTKPSKMAPNMKNIKWVYGSDQKPISITFDYNEAFANDKCYYYVGVQNVTDDSYPISSFNIRLSSVTDDGAGHFRFDFEDIVDWKENCKYDLYTYTYVYDFEEMLAPKTGEYTSYKWGVVPENDIDPYNIIFDEKTGILEYADGDASDAANTKYYFTVKNEYSVIREYYVNPSSKGDCHQLRFAEYLDDSEHYILEVVCKYKGYNSLVDKFEFDYVKYEYTEEPERIVPNGPKDIEMNVKTGELSFTTDDSSDDDNKISYGFSLLKDGKFIKYVPYNVAKSGEAGKVSFAGLYDESGEYVVKIFAKFTNGEPDARIDFEYKFNYTKPEKQLSSPSNVKLKENVVSWEHVQGAARYQVKVDYTDKTETALEYYIEAVWPNNSADISMFATGDYKDVKVSVRAIAKDASVLAPSDFVLATDYEEEIPSLSRYYGFAFPARDKVLVNVTLFDSDNNTVSLPEGWEWLKPNDDLTKYLAGNVYPFTAVYHSQSGDVYENIAVLLLNPLKDEFNSIKANQLVGEAEKVAFIPIIGVYTADEMRLVSSDPNVLKVEKLENAEKVEFDLTANKKGTVTLSYYVANVKVASKKINVIAGDSLSSEEAIEFTIKNREGEPVVFDGSLDIELTKGAEYTIETVADIKDGEEVIKSFTTNITSSDAGVLKVANGSKLTKTGKAKLTFVGAGYVYLTITANDALKTKRTIKIHVTDKSDSAVILEKNELVLNTQKKDVEDSFFVYDGGERELKGVEIYSAKLFDKKCKPIGDLTPAESLVAVNSSNRVIIRLADGATLEAGKYVIGLKFDEEKYIYRFITIKKVSTKPSIKVTQESVPDFAEDDQTTVFRLSGNVDFDNVDIEGMDTDFYRSEYGPGYALLKVTKFNGRKRIKLIIQTSDYKDFTVNVDVKATKSKFGLSATTATLYPDVEGSYFDIKIKNSTKKTVLIDDMADVSLSDSDNYDINYVGNGIYRINVKEGATPASSKKVVLKYRDNSLAEELSFNLTIKTVKFANTKLALGAKSLTMYSYVGQGAQSDTTLKLNGGCDATELLSNVEITEKVGKNKAPALNDTLDVSYDSNTGRIVVKKLSDDLKAGTYNFVIKLKDDTLSKGVISVTLPVKVVTVDGLTSKTKASVKVTAKNNVNLFDRENTSVVCTPKFTNIPAGSNYRIVDITGKDYSLFSIKDNKNILLEDYAVILEKQTYVIKLVYEIEANGAKVRVTSPDIKLKFKTKKASVKLINNGTNVFDYNGSTKDLRLEASCGSKPVKIDSFELTNMLTSFECKGNTIIGDEHVALIDVTSLADAKLQKGKTYTLKFNVYMRGAALDSKPITVSYKVKIAK